MARVLTVVNRTLEAIKAGTVSITRGKVLEALTLIIRSRTWALPVLRILKELRKDGRGAGEVKAQAGRPQQGSSQPQLSSQTQRKMENAGMESGRSRGDTRKGSLEDGRHNRGKSDMEELKAQNEQIIKLLKKMNRNLERLGR